VITPAIISPKRSGVKLQYLINRIMRVSSTPKLLFVITSMTRTFRWEQYPAEGSSITIPGLTFFALLLG
jgi:hypothetical protein